MAKMKKIHEEEIDYDIVVEYHRMQCPLSCGDRVRGMISGDTGTMHTFPGEGHVVAVESEIIYGPGIPKHTVYLKTPAVAQPGRTPLMDRLETPLPVSEGGRAG